MSKKKRRAFTPKQKAEAVKVVKNSGKSVTQVAQEMGFTVSALRNWTRQDETSQSPAPEGPLTTDERAEDDDNTGECLPPTGVRRLTRHGFNSQ